MALIKLGAMVVAISGKLGGHVFARNAGGAYIRTKVTPNNPQTVFQTSVRSVFAQISSTWSSITDAQRTSFRDKVVEFAKTNVFGDLKNPTGKALYQRLNQNLELTGQAQIQTAPSPGEIPQGVLTSVIIGAPGVFNVNTTGDSTGSNILIFATPILSAGTLFIKNRLRSIQVSDGAVDAILDIQSSYTARFGDALATDNVFIGIKFINAKGQASPLQTVRVSA